MQASALASRALGASALTLALLSNGAYAVVYVTGSISAAESNVGLQTQESRGGSASLAFDLGRFIRLGFTHRQDIQTANGYIGMTEDSCVFGVTIDGCAKYDSKTHIISNSIDLTLILYEGEVVVPFIQGGAVVKTYTFETNKVKLNDPAETAEHEKTGPANYGPVPNLGAGIGIRLNRQFTLKLSYTTSPGISQDPIENKVRTVWDKQSSLGLTYQL